ncbi:LOW QUALITY PROTEIN: hypothetical protein Cgig2_010585 [Carnegiea gigantea]|uniref:Large ribosomal subunit protein eL24-related N-terminal domain-containing protein n=1 Tax=Carnegiea gigantea TaxID=171969 RepID=A0A9Q1KTN7_9CARY|nr:LOW QUALITY PROTEIN: hypothetical protein Cgig2_010585 [Carnegiea gigantea]
MVLKHERLTARSAVAHVFLFANSKCKRYFHNRLKPSKLCWTAVYRKQHKKDISAEAVKKRRRAAKKPYSRSIVGATLEVIQKKRSEKPEVRDAAREAALREIKERIKKTKDEKRAKKAEVTAKSQKSQGKGAVKGAAPKGPKLGVEDSAILGSDVFGCSFFSRCFMHLCIRFVLGLSKSISFLSLCQICLL